MKNKKLQKGFAMPVIIGIIVLVVIVGGIAYVVITQQSSDKEGAMIKDKTLEDGTIIKPDGTMVKPDGTMIKPDGTMVKPDGTMVNPDGTMVKKEEGAMMEKEGGEVMVKYSGAVLAGKSAPLLDFMKADYDSAIASDKLVVLYFYANWCPICKAEFPKMQEAFNELTTDKVIGFRVNYNDNQTDNDEKNLAREFGVPYQHTKVFVKNGKQILKAPDSWPKDRYLTEINKAITQ